MQLDKDFHDTLDTCAHMVLGANSWDRPRNDRAVRRSIENAEALLAALPDSLDRPHVSPGTTASPATILTLVWRGGGLASLSVDFNAAGTCGLSWTADARGMNDVNERRGVPVGVAMVLDIAGKIGDMREASGWRPPAP